MEYHSIKWINDNIASRYTREVNIKFMIDRGRFIKDGEEIDGFKIEFIGTGDTEHHLVEDCLILLKKIAEIKCGGGH